MVEIQHDSLGLQRSEMPQIKKRFISDFLKELQKSGVGITMKPMKIGQLKPTQREINLDKVDTIIVNLKNNTFVSKPFIVSSDGRILDGHHQWYAMKKYDPNKYVPCHVVSVDMKRLLKLALAYGNVQTEHIYEGEVRMTTLKTFRKLIREAVDQPSRVDQVKQQQDAEKMSMDFKHRQEVERARAEDFRRKEQERKEKLAKQEAERRAKEAARSINEQFDLFSRESGWRFS